MARITYVQPDGATVTIDVPAGWSLMQAAVSGGVDGIVGECGGCCACATCHGYVDPARADALAPPSEAELAMLECVAAERRPTSRLTCQIRSTDQLDGLVVELPDAQA